MSTCRLLTAGASLHGRQPFALFAGSFSQHLSPSGAAHAWPACTSSHDVRDGVGLYIKIAAGYQAPKGYIIKSKLSYFKRPRALSKINDSGSGVLC